MSKHRTARGREFNMQAFTSGQGDTIAVGNSSRNARGDLLGPGGKVISTVQEISTIVRNQNSKNQSAKVKINPLEQEVGRREIRGADGVYRWEITYADGSVEVQEKLDDTSTQKVTIDREPNLGDL